MAIPLRATGTDVEISQQASAPIQPTRGVETHSVTLPVATDQRAVERDASHKSRTEREIGTIRRCVSLTDLKAGEGGRTLDIHVGNVTLYH